VVAVLSEGFDQMAGFIFIDVSQKDATAGSHDNGLKQIRCVWP
jgi:hypothetical protein